MAWLALAFSVALVAAAVTSTTLRGIRLFRDAKHLLGAVGDGLADLERRAGEAELHLARAEQSWERLERALARLRRSRARLAVLTAALHDVRVALGRVTSVYPSK